MATFSKKYPELKFSLSIGNTPNILSKLENYDIDIAFVEGAVENEEFITEKFTDDELILITSSQHRWKKKGQIFIDELPEEKMIWREADSGTRQIVENALQEHGVLKKINSEMELGSYQSIKSAVEADLGVSILPRLTVALELKYGILHDLNVLDFHISRDLWMVQKINRFRKSGLKYFTNFIQQHNECHNNHRPGIRMRFQFSPLFRECQYQAPLL